jgi:hypothetical protein
MNPESPAPKPYIAPLLYLVVAFIAFFQCLILQKAYFANDLLAFEFPHLRFLKHDLEQGHFSLWDPSVMGGQPMFADPNSMMCNPFHYLIILFPIPYGLSLYFFIHMFLAAWGMHFFLKTLRFSEGTCRVVPLIYALCGDFWWELIHPGILTVLTFWPWFAACLENLCRDWRPRQAFWVGLVFAFIFCAGNFQLMTGVLYGGLVFFAYRLYHWSSVEKTISWRERFASRKLIPILLLGLWSSLPLLMVLIPTYEFSNHSTHHNEAYEQLSGTFSMHPASTYEFLFPFMGIPDGKSPETAIQEINEPNIDNDFIGDFGYLGVWIPFLVYFAFKRKEKRFLYFLSFFSLISLLTAWGRYFPVHRILCEILPGISISRAPFRFLNVYILFVGILSAYGYQTLERFFSEENEKSKSWAMGSLGYGFFLMAIAIFQPGRTWRELLGLGLGMLGLYLWGTQSWKKIGNILFQAALLLPLLLSGWSDFGTGPVSNYDFADKAPIFQFLQDRHGSRFFMDPQIPYPVEENGTDTYFPMPQNEVLDYRVRLVNGYDSLNLKRSIELQQAQLPLPVYASLWSIRGLVFGQDHGESKEFNHQVIGLCHYYEFQQNHPFLLAPSQIQVIPDDTQCLAAIKSPNFNPETQCILSQPLPPNLASQLSGQKANLQYDWVKDESDDESFKVHLDKGSLVTFAEVMFPGWKAFLDDQSAQILTANYNFRALVIPSGDHTVEFKYEPFWWRNLMVLLAFWILTIPVIFLAWKWKPGLA